MLMHSPFLLLICGFCLFLVGYDGFGTVDGCGGDYHLFYRFLGGNVEHNLLQNALYNRAKSAGTRFALDGYIGDSGKRLVLKFKLDTVH